jgi:hypothetical protein
LLRLALIFHREAVAIGCATHEMRARLQEFALSLHPEKTRLIEFGRFAAKWMSMKASSGSGHDLAENALEAGHRVLPAKVNSFSATRAVLSNKNKSLDQRRGRGRGPRRASSPARR